jgi:predicted SAM-dependent methyltransferase
MKPFPLMAIETTIFTKPVRHAALSQPMPNRPECAANLQVATPRPTKVNVGSGGQAVAGWLNVDKSPAVVLARWRRVRRALAFAGVLTDQQRQGFSTDVVYGDATKRLRFSDRSVDFLYCSHMIEHLSREQGMGFLIEVMRILKPGGMIRLATPDLAQLVSQYVADAGCDPSRAGDAFVSRMHFYHQTDGSFLRGLISRYLSGHWHQWLYDNASLSALLNGAGFAEINECQFRQGAFPDLQQIESRADSLFVQATKPLDT